MTTATKQGHTPGKWRIGDAGKSVFGPPSDQPAPVLICSVPGMSSRVSLAERQANARLIAAAPCLLEALQGVADLLGESGGAIHIGPMTTRDIPATIAQTGIAASIGLAFGCMFGLAV